MPVDVMQTVTFRDVRPATMEDLVPKAELFHSTAYTDDECTFPSTLRPITLIDFPIVAVNGARGREAAVHFFTRGVMPPKVEHVRLADLFDSPSDTLPRRQLWKLR
ncbi:MAG: hypothetical protein HY975_04315 [Candidatus Kerfeldbacteria bacterium]|nr:hypothetical protein [Candidatus Kerfeldbacteria bacterium]